MMLFGGCATKVWASPRNAQNYGRLRCAIIQDAPIALVGAQQGFLQVQLPQYGHLSQLQ